LIADEVDLRHSEQVGNSVLIVDDDASFREAITELLRTRGFQIAGYAVDEEEAIGAAHRLLPDAILLDATLAASDNFELVRRLSGCNQRIPVLLTSADSDATSESLARECGAVGFIPKTELAGANLQHYFPG
jgi:CheY-like chemotaxis protein